MLNFFKKSRESKIVAPVGGQCVDLSNVPDKVFSDKLLGDGVAFIFNGEYVYAPSDGKISMIAATKHAFGITDANGLEILVHIGLDTVTLSGEGFEVLVTENQNIKAGTKVIKLDRKFIEEKSINLITPVVLTNSSGYEITKEPYQNVQVGDTVVTAIKK